LEDRVELDALDTVSRQVPQNLRIVLIVRVDAPKGDQAGFPGVFIDLQDGSVDVGLLERVCHHGQQYRAVDAGLPHGVHKISFGTVQVRGGPGTAGQGFHRMPCQGVRKNVCVKIYDHKPLLSVWSGTVSGFLPAFAGPSALCMMIPRIRRK
jgi:hypothetical protein